MLSFEAKDAAESVVLTFDFSKGLATGETLTGTPRRETSSLEITH